jgi:hypothetical protein
MKLVVAALTLATAGSAMAQSSGVSETGIRYNEVGVGYASLAASGTTLQGYTLNASALVEKNFVIDATYANLSKSSYSISDTGLNVGYRIGVAPNVDAGVKVGYVSGTAGGTTESSYVVGGFVNAQLTPEWVLGGNVLYTGLANTNYFYTASLGYHITENITARGSIRGSSGNGTTTTYVASVGYNF